MLENFEKTILSIQTDISLIKLLVMLMMDNLKTRTNVASFIGVVPKTIDNWVENGTLINDYHYMIKNNQRKEFVPDKIIEFKQELGRKCEEKKHVQRQLNPIASKFLVNKRVA